MSLEGFIVFKGLKGDESSWFLDIFIPIVFQISFFFSCSFNKFLKNRLESFNGLQLDLDNSHNINLVGMFAVLGIG